MVAVKQATSRFSSSSFAASMAELEVMSSKWTEEGMNGFCLRSRTYLRLYYNIYNIHGYLKL